MSNYYGQVVLGAQVEIDTLFKNGALAPANCDALPTYRVYGPAGLMLSGTMAFKDTAAITNATNATPVVITSANHGLTTGTLVTISGVGGNGGANGSFVITVIDANTFSLNGSAGTGAYTSGGTWNVSGLYAATVTCSAGSGFLAGQTYSVICQGAVSAAQKADLQTFTVV